MVLEVILNFLINFFQYMWFLFLDWLFIFVAPFFKLDMLWVIVPIWINWFFTEFFQERDGTRLGNAITNGAIMLWVGIDLLRYTVREVYSVEKLSLFFFSKVALCLIVIIYGIFIISQGLKRRKYIKFLGRVRETTYVLLMFTPMIYGVISLNIKFLLAFFVYLPIWYFLIEFIVRKVSPNNLDYEDETKSNDLFSNNNTNNSDLFSNKNNNFNNNNLFK